MTAYTITLTSKTGMEISNTVVTVPSLDQAIEQANQQMDTILEGHGLLTAWAVYTAADGRLMASWCPAGHTHPACDLLGIARLA